jgi:hypothetical protein
MCVQFVPQQRIFHLQNVLIGSKDPKRLVQNTPAAISLENKAIGA